MEVTMGCCGDCDKCDSCDDDKKTEDEGKGKDKTEEPTEDQQ